MKRLPEAEFDQESWRAVPGYAGLYEVSDQGRVRSLERTVALEHPYGGAIEHQRAGVELLAASDRNGRIQVCLCRDGVKRYRGVASLVMEAFAEPAPRGWCIAYGNGDPADCALTNLTWRPRGSRRVRPT